MGKAAAAVRLAKSARKAIREATRPKRLKQFRYKESQYVPSRRVFDKQHTNQEAIRRARLAMDDEDYSDTFVRDLSAHTYGAAMQQAAKLMAYLKKNHPAYYRGIKDADSALAPQRGLVEHAKRAVAVDRKGDEAAVRAAIALGVKAGKRAQLYAEDIRTHARRLAERNLLPAGVVASAATRKKEKK